MKYAVGMGSDGNICIPSFIYIGSGIQKLWGRGGLVRIETHTQRQQDNLTSILLFFQSKESRLKAIVSAYFVSQPKKVAA
jgi:hypothetical protein